MGLLEDPAISKTISDLDPTYIEKARNHSVTPEDVVACVMKMLAQ